MKLLSFFIIVTTCISIHAADTNPDYQVAILGKKTVGTARKIKYGPPLLLSPSEITEMNISAFPPQTQQSTRSDGRILSAEQRAKIANREKQRRDKKNALVRTPEVQQFIALPKETQQALLLQLPQNLNPSLVAFSQLSPNQQKNLLWMHHALSASNQSIAVASLTPITPTQNNAHNFDDNLIASTIIINGNYENNY